MGEKRHESFEWVNNGIFELCERYREQALRLIQDAETESKEEIFGLVIDQIRKDFNRIEALLKKPLTRGVNKALNFEMPDFKVIDPKYLMEITQLTDEFKQKVKGMSQSFSIEDRMNESPFLLGGVMRCIVDLRAKIENAAKPPVEDVQFKALNQEEFDVYPFVRKIKSDISPRVLKEVVIAVVRGSELRGIGALGEQLGLDVNLYTLLARYTVPKDGEQRVAYIKVWNWTIENILLQAQKKDGLSIRAQKAIERLI